MEPTARRATFSQRSLRKSPVSFGVQGHFSGTANFLREETDGLMARIRRAASSIPSNIAEGCGRDGDAELARFCLIARGSATELEYQILLAHHLKLIPSGPYRELTEEVTEIKRMLTVLVQKLNADRARPAESLTLVAATGRAMRFKGSVACIGRRQMSHCNPLCKLFPAGGGYRPGRTADLERIWTRFAGRAASTQSSGRTLQMGWTPLRAALPLGKEATSFGNA